MRVLLFIIFLGAFSVLAQELYPINKDGKWGLMRGDGEITLAPIYDYISYQPQGDKFIFDQRGKFGAMDQDGSVYAAAEFDAIEFFDTITSAHLKAGKWQLYLNAKLEVEVQYDSINHVTAEIYSLHKRGGFVLYDTQQKKFSPNVYLSWEMDQGFLRPKLKSEHTDLYRTRDMFRIGDSITTIDWDWNGIGIMEFKAGMQIIDAKTYSTIEEVYPTIERQYLNWFLFEEDTGSVAYNLLTQERYRLRKVDEILDIKSGLIAFVVDDKAGVWSIRQNKTILAPQFSGVALKNGLIYTNNGSRFGLCTSSGKEILAPDYDDISDFGNIYRVKMNGRYGLASKSGKLIEKCEYNKIDVFAKNVKCYKGKTLTTINLDANGNLKDRTEYESFMTVSFAKRVRARGNAKSLTFNGNNISAKSETEWHKKGWHQREIERKKGDSTVIVYGNWGLWDENDSVRIRYQFRHIDVVPAYSHLTAGYKARPHKRPGSKQGIRNSTQRGWYYQIGDNIAYGNGKFKLIDHEAYRFLSGTEFLTIHMDDWKEHALARGMAKGPVLVDSSAHIVFDDITYFDKYVENKIRICQGGEVVPIKHNRGGLLITYAELFNNLGLRYPKIDREYPHFRIKKGRWHFVDRDGNLLNEEPFQYAHPFKDNRAIVLRNNLWGVVDSSMNVIVPLEFKSVKRVYVDGKTYFKVQRPHSEPYFYNRLAGTYRPTEITSANLTSAHQGKWLYKVGDEVQLLDSNLNSLGKAEYTAIHQGSDRKQLAAVSGGYQFITEAGKKVGPIFETWHVSELKHGRYKVTKGGNNFAIVDAQGAYLVPKYIGNKIIAQNEEFIFYLDYNLKFKYWSNSSLQTPKKVKIIDGNLERNLLLVRKGKKTKIYDYKIGKYINKNAPGIISMEGPGYIYEDDNLKGIISYEGDTLLHAKYWSIDFNKFGWGLGKIKTDQFEIINSEGKVQFDYIFNSVNEVYIKSGYFMVRSEGKVGVMSKDFNWMFPLDTWSINQSEGKYFVISDTSKYRQYFSADGDFVFKEEYYSDWGFPPNGYITKDPKIKGRKQYSYFYDGYKNQQMKFSSIYPVSSNGFLLREETQMGVYGYEGDTIVPIEYHELRAVRGKFQVRFFNSFGYFENDGRALFDPKTLE